MNNLISYFKNRKKKLGKRTLPLHEPEINSGDKKEILKSLNSGYVSTVGRQVEKFENEIKKVTKSKHVISTINGTSAIHIGLKIIGVNSNDEVLLPSIGFVAAANAILYNNAFPHFVDSEKSHFGIDPEKLYQYLISNTFLKNGNCINKKTKRVIRAIIIVHVFGHPAKISKIISIAKKFKIKVLEDAAEALGSKYHGKHVGNFGDVGVLSFNGNKIITTGVGGVILCNNKNLAKKAKHITTTSKKKHKWEYIHDSIGFNYRLASLNAALGISQIRKLKGYILKKHILFKKIKRLILKSDEVYLLDQPKFCKSNFWLHTLILKKPSFKKRNSILNKFHKENILARPVWRPLHKLSFLKKYPKMNLVNTKEIENKIINIPSSYYL